MFQQQLKCQDLLPYIKPVKKPDVPPDYSVKGEFFTVSTEKASKIVSEYDQEIPQSQTADNPMAPRGRATQPSRDTRKTN